MESKKTTVAYKNKAKKCLLDLLNMLSVYHISTWPGHIDNISTSLNNML